eukprot:12375892-Alexandrium_andersonii.AAC.1
MRRLEAGGAALNFEDERPGLPARALLAAEAAAAGQFEGEREGAAVAPPGAVLGPSARADGPADAAAQEGRRYRGDSAGAVPLGIGGGGAGGGDLSRAILAGLGSEARVRAQGARGEESDRRQLGGPQRRRLGDPRRTEPLRRRRPRVFEGATPCLLRRRCLKPRAS